MLGYTSLDCFNFSISHWLHHGCYKTLSRFWLLLVVNLETLLLHELENVSILILFQNIGCGVVSPYNSTITRVWLPIFLDASEVVVHSELVKLREVMLNTRSGLTIRCSETESCCKIINFV